MRNKVDMTNKRKSNKRKSSYKKKVNRMSKIGEYNGVASYLKQRTTNDDKNYIDGIFSGLKWQCVEFVRRYFILKYGITFQNVKNAYEMMSIRKFYDINDINNIKTVNVMFIREMRYKNPKKDDIIYIKDFEKENDISGHVGLIVDYDAKTGHVYVADQNYEKGFYWKGDGYAYIIDKNDPSIIGWARVKL
jgi:hypothetical protein